MTSEQSGPVRETTYDERLTWGTCPTCQAQHGQFCHAEVGLQLGRRVDGRPMETGDGVHLSRIKLAPMKVQEVPVT